jgi:stearoyl-CoA desaturase (delta-9 desaturase)
MSQSSAFVGDSSGLSSSPVSARLPRPEQVALPLRSFRQFGLVMFHILALGPLFTGVTWEGVAIGVVLYSIRMFGTTGVYHRYFSHRTYKTSRWFQFVLLCLASTSLQRGAIWWATHHRDHHKNSDHLGDAHSPRLYGAYHSHMGWLWSKAADSPQNVARDLLKYPELRIQDKYWMLPGYALGFAIWYFFGWSVFFVGFIWSTLIGLHLTMCVNSVVHLWGTRRFDTADDSRNNWWMALLVFGEGWHNNHHHDQSVCRQGLEWYEVDLTYYILRSLQAVGLIWDIKEPNWQKQKPAA